ncbi:hypothetical protein [Rhizobium leguminosarum]|uniref:hypothetical protein n=1 Tax=Rhizobium leguminosarum TaxID=384 RepID=UPI0014416873|nr:hypothetical protein [Rhizobium leguminosarum]MBY5794887.1 hypothetical protein [Rhizobium leguminosarum]NKK32506.1 hypothetical protein [Rhizobium leguminosarum bv. viciae]
MTKLQFLLTPIVAVVGYVVAELGFTIPTHLAPLRYVAVIALLTGWFLGTRRLTRRMAGVRELPFLLFTGVVAIVAAFVYHLRGELMQNEGIPYYVISYASFALIFFCLTFIVSVAEDFVERAPAKGDEG